MAASQTMANTLALLPAVFMALSLVIGQDGKAAGKWSYFMATHPNQSSITRQLTFHEVHHINGMICPRNYFISSLTYSFVNPVTDSGAQQGKEYASTSDGGDRLAKLSLFEYLELLPAIDQLATRIHNEGGESEMKAYNVSYDRGLLLDMKTSFGLCPTLVHCLGHQACVFRVGIDICHHDPFPGYRKTLRIHMLCSRHDQGKPRSEYSEKRAEQIAYLRASPEVELSSTGDKNAEDGFSFLEVQKSLVGNKDVFDVTCPTLLAANLSYHGNCPVSPPSPESTADDLWMTLTRASCSQCRRELLEVYCAYKYSPTGDCLPPFVYNKHEGWTHASLPYIGSRPAPTAHTGKVTSLHHQGSGRATDSTLSRLTPARIGFIILSHTSPLAVMQLLSAIYRPQHYYVVHIDKRQPDMRQELEDMVSSDYPGGSNIHVLPADRSFETGWGSYQILRAQLEGFEELLRLGVWDFAINLSGLDLPLRPVDDLATMLAPYRGQSIIRMNPAIDYDKDHAIKKAWHSCGGHLFEVTPRGRLSHSIQGSSQWAVFARDFVEYLSRDHRSGIPDNLQYYIQTSAVPDEVYLAAMTTASHFRTRYIVRGFTFMKPFVGEDSNNLCRHRDETDMCGRGPGTFEESDAAIIPSQAHNYFFGRKFSSRHDDVTRLHLLQTITENAYNRDALQAFSRSFLENIGRLAVVSLAKEREKGSESMTLSDVTGIRITPTLLHRDPCCQLLYDTHQYVVQDYTYWLTLRVRAGAEKEVQAEVVPRQGFNYLCYPEGHVRALHVTSRRDPLFSETGLKVNLALPYETGIQGEIWVHLVIHQGSPSGKCAAASGDVDDPTEIYAKWPEVKQHDSVPGTDNGVPVADKAVPDADKGVPAAGNGVLAADNGVPAANNGVPAADNGVPDADNGVPTVDKDVPDADNGVPAADNGVPVAEDGVPDNNPVDTNQPNAQLERIPFPQQMTGNGPQTLRHPPEVANPGLHNPEVAHPEMLNPGMNNPGMLNPDVAKPGMLNPGMANPEMLNPGMLNPEMAKPGMLNPGLANPEMFNPGMLNLQVAKPGMANPRYEAPEGFPNLAFPNPGFPHPGYPQPGFPHPGYPQVGDPHPGYRQPGVPQPGYPQPGVAQPGVPQPGVPQPGVPQPGYPHPAYPQTGYPQPGFPQPGFPQPGPYPGPHGLPAGDPGLNSAPGILMRFSLISPTTEVRCAEDVELKSPAAEHRDPNMPAPEATTFSHVLRCGELEAGWWTVTVQQMDQEDAYIYQTRFVILTEAMKDSDVHLNQSYYNDYFQVLSVAFADDLKTHTDQAKHTSHSAKSANMYRFPEAPDGSAHNTLKVTSYVIIGCILMIAMAIIIKYPTRPSPASGLTRWLSHRKWTLGVTCLVLATVRWFAGFPAFHSGTHASHDALK